MFYAIPILLLTDLILGKYSLLFLDREFPVIYVRNFLFVGLPYFALGACLKKYSDKISKIKYYYWLIGGIFIDVSNGKMGIAIFRQESRT